jgi:hypothetical protein
VKYIGDDNFNHLIQALKKHYDVSIDRTGSLYCGITLRWDYSNRTLDICMPGYVQEQLIKYNHPKPKTPHHCPWEPSPKKFGKQAQDLPPPDVSPPLNGKQKKLIQKIVGNFLYYCRATEPTILHALSKLAAQQATVTEQTMQRCRQFLDYMSMHLDAMIR